MGTYISRSNVEAVFGVANIAAWSNLDKNDAQVQESRVTTAIAYAETYVEDRFRDGLYTIPFVGNSANSLLVIKDCMAKIAGMWLYESRGFEPKKAIAGKFKAMREAVEDVISDYLSGQHKLDVARYETGPTGPSIAPSRPDSDEAWCYGNPPARAIG